MRDYKIYLQDILEAILKIERFTAQQTFFDFEKNELVTDAVFRNLEVIGEAAKQLPTQIREKYPDVDWRESMAMRNIICHEYFGIDVEIIWETIQTDLPNLKLKIQKILSEN